MDLYHERWQPETTYFSIKATILDRHVLRSRSLTGLDQQVYAPLTTYQALIHAAADTAHTRPGPDTDRISFTVPQTTAADTITTATGILPPAGPADLVARYRATIDRANKVLDACTDLGVPLPRPGRSGPSPSVRWALTHMIEETGRHAGHADILRELVDGTTGR
ncbi:DUF664 domain-containing protein [Streptomyces scopuliridis]|uniref:mycothiol transferase n=1 Tax=Streptomyces scopuliridis TaxID=452529 RepID=UPI0036A4979C